jgi:hypothetical protein
MDVVHQIPWQLNNFSGTSGGGSYNLQDYEFNYAIGGIPFLSATRDAWPYTEGMAEIRKQQFDSFAEPGEQSIYGWWLRSQSNFTAGAGILYQDPDNDNQFNFRFQDSLGVDPWTSGQVSLLKVPSNLYTLSSTFNRARGYVDNSGVDAAFYADGGSLFKVTASGRVFASNPSIGNTLDFANTGPRTLILASDGIWSGIDTGAATKMYTLPITPTTGAIEFVKGRIVVCIDNQVWAVPINTGATAALPGSAAYIHTDPTWRWRSITEGPQGWYIAGQNTTTSNIHKFGIDFNGSTEVIQATVTASTPVGEQINTIYGYIGTFVGIATTKGFRVGEFDSNGDVAYGPLLFTPAGGCISIVGFDRFMYVGSAGAHDGSSGLFRVDLGTQVQEQATRAVRYAYARDIYASGQTNPISSVTILGNSGRLVMMVLTNSVWLQSATDLYPTGYLKTGRIRYNTEEPKLYKFLSVRTPSPLQGTVQVSILTQTGTEIPYITYDQNFSPGTGDISTPQPNGPQVWIQLKITLGRLGTDATLGGILNGWQVKALPGSIRQRMISHTFQCFDEESDMGGQRVGTDGYARQRLEDFRALARAGDVVTFQELYEDISTLVIIDDWKFTQLAPPGPGGSTLGGYLTVIMRTVAESV